MFLTYFLYSRHSKKAQPLNEAGLKVIVMQLSYWTFKVPFMPA